MPPFNRLRGASPRALRLAALGLVAGAAAGMAAAGDIRTSYDRGRIGVAAWPSAAPQPAVEPAGDQELGSAHGFALAAQLGYRRPAQCGALNAEFRAGCRDYLEQQRAEAAPDALALAGAPL